MVENVKLRQIFAKIDFSIMYVYGSSSHAMYGFYYPPEVRSMKYLQTESIHVAILPSCQSFTIVHFKWSKWVGVAGISGEKSYICLLRTSDEDT